MGLAPWRKQKGPLQFLERFSLCHNIVFQALGDPKCVFSGWLAQYQQIET